MSRFEGLIADSRLKGFVRYFKNTSWGMAEQVFRIISGLIVSIVLAKHLGPEDFGLYSYILAFVAIFSIVGKLGLDRIVVRNLVEHSVESQVCLGTAFWSKFFGAILAVAITAVATIFISGLTLKTVYILTVASGIIFQSFEVIDFYFQSKVKLKFPAICKIFQLSVSTSLKLYLVYINAELYWFAIAVLFDQLMLAITYSILGWQQKVDGFYSYFSIKVAKKMLKDSWPLILSGVMVMIYMRIDLLMIEHMLEGKELGIYALSARISEAWYFVPMVITNSLFPAIVKVKANPSIYYSRLQKLITFNLWLAIIISIITTAIAPWIVLSFFGNAYIEAIDVLKIHIWASVFVFIGVASGSWLVSENLQKIAFFRTLTGAVTNVVLNLLLIPVWGIRGAAIATLISYMVAGFLFDIFNPKTRKMFYMKISGLILKVS